MRSFNPIVAATILLTAGQVEAFWRMPCLSRSGLARLDPLVDNGTLSSHNHAIHGSSGFSMDADYDALMNGDCTSCQVTQDKSAYWTPALYFQNNSTGEYTLVEQVGGMLAYYLLYPNAGNTSLSAFPAGFEMIAGDTNQRNFTYPVPDIAKSLWNVEPYNTQAFLRQAALGFNCLDYSITPEGSLYRHFLPDKSYLDAHCTDGVRFELMFPSCWNGKDVTSENKKSHVAYPSEVMTGNCPEGFETRLPSMFFETIWDTYAFAGQEGTFMLSNGDPTGYGYHGDFMMGWDPDFLQEAVDTCTNLSGEISDCAIFDIQDSADYSTCSISVPAEVKMDAIATASLSTMPGDPAIAWGPGYAGGADAGKSATATTGVVYGSAMTGLALSYTPGSSLASSESYIPGGIFAVSTGVSNVPSTSSSASSTTPAAKVQIKAASSTSSAPSFISTSYTTLGPNLVEEVVWVEEVVTVTASTTYGAGAEKRHAHGHAQAHHNKRGRKFRFGDGGLMN